MTPGEAAKIIDEVGKLWPKRVRAGEDPHPWTEASQVVYHETLCHRSLELSEEQGLAVVRQLKREGVYVPNDRGWKILIDRMRDIAKRRGETPQARQFVDDHPHTHDDGSVDTGPIRSIGDWARDSADATQAMIEAACTCPRFGGAVYQIRPHPIGGSACNNCGGSFTGKMYAAMAASKDLRKAKGDGRDRSREARALDLSLGLIR